METNKDLIRTAIVRLGSQEKLAAAAGVTQPVISKALKAGRVGPRLAVGLDRATNGEISKSVLRPDLWPDDGAAHGPGPE